MCFSQYLWLRQIWMRAGGRAEFPQSCFTGYTLSGRIQLIHTYLAVLRCGANRSQVALADWGGRQTNQSRSLCITSSGASSSVCTYCGELVGNDAKISIEHLNINCHTGCFKVTPAARHSQRGGINCAPFMSPSEDAAAAVASPEKCVLYNLFVCYAAGTDLNCVDSSESENMLPKERKK